MTSIGSWTFQFCSILEDFYCWADNVPTTDGNAFYQIPFLSATLHVPATSLDAYKNTHPWSEFGNIVALTDEDPKSTGVNSLKTGDHISPEATYSFDGSRLSNPQRGLNIIRMSDGTTKKIYIKNSRI